MDQPRVILLCGNRVAMPALQELLFFKQLAVIVIPATCVDMIENLKTVLAGSDIPVVIVEKDTADKKIIAAIKEYHADTGLIISFSYKVSPAVYTIPSRGFYNVHPGPLPAYRGPDPVFQQIKNKEKNVGVTIHKLDEGFDTGPVVINEMIRLNPTDTHGIVNEKIAFVAANLVRTLLKLLGFGVAIPSRVQDQSAATYHKRQGAADITIDWEQMDATTIVALINACNPWNKGAVTKLNTKIIRLLEAGRIPYPAMEKKLPGTILAIDERGLIIATISDEAIAVQIIYIDEGFLMAKRLAQFGVRAGSHLGKS